MPNSEHQWNAGSLLGLTLGRWCCSGASWCASRAQQPYSGGAEEGQAPLLLSSSILTACAQETREGFILKHPSACLFIVLGNRGSRCLKGLLKGFHSVVLFTYVHACWLLLFSYSVLSHSFETPWTIARHAPLFMGFPRQEYWSGLPYPPPGDLPDPGMEPASPALAGGFYHWATRQVFKFGQFWKIRMAFLVWKLVGSNEWREHLQGSAPMHPEDIGIQEFVYLKYKSLSPGVKSHHITCFCFSQRRKMPRRLTSDTILCVWLWEFWMSWTKRCSFEPCYLECVIYLSQPPINLKRTSTLKQG